MTPEDRAERLWNELDVLPMGPAIRAIAAAIREAVAEEREACADIAIDCDTGVKAWKLICARGEKNRKPDPSQE